MAIVTINPGDTADATVLMSNFNDLDTRVKNNADNLESAVSSLTSTFTSVVYNTLSVYQTVNELDTSGEIELGLNTVNTITPTDEVTFKLPEVTDYTQFYQILVQVKLTDTSFLSAEDNGLDTDYYFNQIIPTFDYTGNYDIIYVYDNAERKWCCGYIFKGVVS